MGFRVGFGVGPVRVSSKGVSIGAGAGPVSYSKRIAGARRRPPRKGTKAKTTVVAKRQMTASDKIEAGMFAASLLSRKGRSEFGKSIASAFRFVYFSVIAVIILFFLGVGFLLAY